MIPVEAIFSPQSLRGHRENLIGGKPSVETAEFTTISTSPSPRLGNSWSKNYFAYSAFKQIFIPFFRQVAQSSRHRRDRSVRIFLPGTGYRVPGTGYRVLFYHALRPTPSALPFTAYPHTVHPTPRTPARALPVSCEVDHRYRYYARFFPCLLNPRTG